ncbi:hypothetical protein GCM10023321_39240 [Pseudonocardia eucalypti]|uniref:Uncharacterized protein n=1 Tax=Pseudonocardia eucalypti TaxID=648755 RepID=A0ABP9QB05_9PSEU
MRGARLNASPRHARVRPNSGALASFRRYQQVISGHSEAAREQLAAGGADTAGVVGEYQPGTEINDLDNTFTARLLYAFWRLCEQGIARTDFVEPNHSAGHRPQFQLTAVRVVGRRRP